MLVVNPQFAAVENNVEKLNTYWVRNGSRRCSEHIPSAITPPSARPSCPPFLKMGFSRRCGHRALAPSRKICLGSERPGTPLPLSPCMGPKRVSLRPPAHQARASGLTHPHVVRLADPDYPRCAVVVRLSAHKPRFPRLLTSRCEISSRRRYAAAAELRARGRTSTVVSSRPGTAQPPG